jgi:hypothetical protein
MGDDMPKTFRWHKLSLPLFHHETASATITIENPETGEQQQVAPTVLFTETKTIPTPETQDEAKPEDPKP